MKGDELDMLSIPFNMYVSLVYGVLDIRFVDKQSNEEMYVLSNVPDDSIDVIKYFNGKAYHVCSIPPIHDMYHPKDFLHPTYFAFMIPKVKLQISNEIYNNKYLVIHNDKTKKVSNDILFSARRASVSYLKDNVITIWNRIGYEAMYKDNKLITIIYKHNNDQKVIYSAK